eukprot:12538705-Alexandrium_andersonii.AAC.1
MLPALALHLQRVEKRMHFVPGRRAPGAKAGRGAGREHEGSTEPLQEAAFHVWSGVRVQCLGVKEER